MEANLKQIKALEAHADYAVDKQPSPGGPHYNDKATMAELCRIMKLCPDDLEYLRRLCAHGRKHGVGWLSQCMSTVKACETTCDKIKKDWLTVGRALEQVLCPGQNQYSRITIDEFSDNNQVRLDQVVPNFGPGYVNAMPVPPQSAIRLEHAPRPGYVTEKIAVDLALANNGQNYLDIEVQFYLGPGGTVKGKELGPKFAGNQFLNKDGTQIHLEFPPYRAKPVDVGSAERLAVEIRHAGGVNNLISAMVIIYHDAECWAELCNVGNDCC